MEDGKIHPSVRWCRNFAARWHDPDFIARELRQLLTDDFVRVDHRRLVGVPGEVGPDEYVEQQMSFSGSGSERPTVEILSVLGTRGDRCVAIRSRIAYPTGGEIALVSVRSFDDAVEKCSRLVIFDADDVESAQAELDRLYANLSERSGSE
ncbi:MAG: hypothetical protein ACR2NL_07185 [Acidimicrobiia bacterium]